MLRKVYVQNEGDTDLLPDSHISKGELFDYVKKCIENGKKPPVVKPVLLPSATARRRPLPVPILRCGPGGSNCQRLLNSKI